MTKAFSFIHWVDIINKKKYAKVRINTKIKVLVIYITFFNLWQIIIYLVKKTQVVLLVVKKVIILAK